MGLFSLFRNRNEEANIEVARAMALQKHSDRTQTEHERNMGVKKEVIRDADLYQIFDALCYDYTKVNIKDEQGHEQEQLVIGGLKQDFVSMRSMVSQNNSFRFYEKTDAEIFNLEVEADLLILETQKPVDEATIENFVFNNTVSRLARANNIDSINGRKLRAILLDVTATRVEVGDANKNKGPY